MPRLGPYEHPWRKNHAIAYIYRVHDGTVRSETGRLPTHWVHAWSSSSFNIYRRRDVDRDRRGSAVDRLHVHG